MAGGTIFSQPQKLLFSHITLNNGLSQANNDFIYKDSKGFVWISSVDGLNRFDGQEIKIYRQIPGDSTSINGQNIQGVFSEDSKGDIWFSTYKILNCYRRDKDHFESFQLTDSTGKSLFGFYNCGMDNQGILWLLQGNQLHFFDTDSQKFLTKSHYLFDGVQRGEFLFDEHAGYFSFFCFSFQQPGLLASKISAGYLALEKEILFSDTIQKDAQKFKIQDLYIESDSLVWLATKTGLISLNPKKKNNNTFHTFNRQKVENFTAIQPYEKNLWAVSSSSYGLLFFDRIQEKFVSSFHSTMAPLSLANNAVGDIYIDRDKGFWLTIDRIGVDYSYPQKIKFTSHLNSRNSLEYQDKISVSSLVEIDSQTYWASSYKKGIFILNSRKELWGKITQENFPQLPSNKIGNIFKDHLNRVWILTYSGLAYFDSKSNSLQYINAEYYLFGLQLRNRDILLCPSSGGIQRVRWSGGKAAIELESLNEFKNHKFYYLHEADDGLIYGCQDLNKLAILDLQTEIKKYIPLEGEIKHISSLPGMDSVLWIGTGYGLVKLNKKSNSTEYITHAFGLPNSTIYSAIPDSKGAFWLSSNEGIFQFNPNDSSISHYKVMDGISSSEFNTYAHLKRKNGEIWFGSADGITTFLPQNIESHIPKPNTKITQIKINDEEWAGLRCVKNPGVSNVEEMERIVLEYRQNTVSFEFSSLEFSDPKTNEYKYRMEGYDKIWVNVGTQNFARYSKIPPGEYMLYYNSSNSDGKWGEEKRLEILIKAPFHQTTEFFALLIIGITGIIYGIYKYRLNQVQKELKLKQAVIESEMKALRAQMKPHFIFNCMTSIKLYVKRNKPELASQYLDQFATLIRDIFNISSDDSINLEDEINFLESYLKIEKIRLKEKLNWSINIDKKSDNFGLKIPSLILQPFVENAIKHGIEPKASPGYVLIDIQKEENVLCCIIEDDGVGKAYHRKKKQKYQIHSAEKGHHVSKGEEYTRERMALYDQKNGTSSSWESIDKYDEGIPCGTRIIIKIELINENNHH